ncbi:hypothetical protein WA158_006123 [Blastocystis sp. Blastoise]
MDPLAEFIGITDADSETANYYLEMADYDVNAAVSLYFENNQPATSAVESPKYEDPNDYMRSDSPIHDYSPSYDDSYDSPSDRKAADDLYDSQGVLKPIEQKVERLVDNNEMFGFPNQVQINSIPFEDFSNMNTHDGGMDEYYRSQSSYLFTGTISQAQESAKKQNKILLINIYTSINRSVFEDECIQDLLRESFIFCQLNGTTREAQQILSAYGYTSLPVVYFLFPPYWNLLKQLQVSFTAEDVLLAMIESLEMDTSGFSAPSANGGQDNYEAPPLPEDMNTFLNIPAENKNNTPIDIDIDMTKYIDSDDDNKSIDSNKIIIPQSDTTISSVSPMSTNEIQDVKDTNNHNTFTLPECPSIPSNIPSNMLCRLRLRSPQGMKTVSLPKTWTISQLYAYTGKIAFPENNKPFSIAVNNKKLSLDDHSTLEDNKLNGVVVFIEYL